MGNILGLLKPLFDGDTKTAMDTLSYLHFYLLSLVILAIAFILCIYLNRRQSKGASEAISDEERNSPEGRDEKAPLLPAQHQSHQEKNRERSTDLQSCAYGNEKISIRTSDYGATTPLRVLDKRSELENTINEAANVPRRSAPQATAHVPKSVNFTKY